MNNKADEEVDLRDYVNLVRKRWLSIVLIAGIITLVAGIVSFLKPSAYESYSFIKIGQTEKGPLEVIETTIELTMSESTLTEIGKPVEKTASEIKGSIKIEKTGELLRIVTQGSSPEEAFKLNQAVNKYILDRHQKLFSRAQSFVENYIKEMQELIKQTANIMAAFKTSKSDVSALKLYAYVDRHTQLQLNLQEKQRDMSSLYKPTEEVSPAFLPGEPVPAHKKRNVIIAAVIGLFAGVFWAGLAEFLEKSK